MIRKCFLLFLILISSYCFAQKYAFKQYSAENGLSHNSVNDIIQTKDGYIWVATRNGISKFNGKDFENFNKENGLTSSIINSLFEDSKGRLWIGSFDKGAYYIEDDKIISLEDIHKPNYYNVNSFLESNDGTIYMFCNNGVIVYKDGLQNVIPLNDADEESVKPSQAAWIDDNTIYIATSDTGIAILKLKEERISYINSNTHGIEDVTYSVIMDSDNNIWVGTKGELLKLKNENIVARYKFDREEYNINRVTDIVARNESELLLSFEGNGFTIFNKRTGSYDEMIRQRNGLPHRNIYAILEDNEGNIWLATRGAGIVRFRDKGFKLFDDTNGLQSNNIYGMASTQNKSYVATSLGIVSIENNKVTDTIYDVGSVAFIKAYDDKNVIFSNFSSVVEFPEDGQLRYYNDEKGLFTYAYKNDSSTLLYNFYKRQLRVIQKDTTYVFENTEKLQPFIRDLIEVENHFVYFTSNGVYEIRNGEINQIEFDYDRVEVRSLDHIDDTTFMVGDSENIHYITYENSKYNIKSYPLHRFGDTKDFVTLEVVENDLWLGGDGFIKNINFNALIENDSIIIRNYKIDKTLFNGIRNVSNLTVNNLIPTHDGQLMGRDIKGLYMFNASEYKYHSIPSKLNLKRIELFSEKLNDSLYKKNNKVVFPYDENYLTFYMDALSFTYPEDVKFKYRLKGLRAGDQWSNPTSDNKVVFSYLPPGDYNFEFTADNGNEIWQENVNSYTFEIKAPFWRLPWFWVITILGISGFTLLYIHRRNKIKTQQAQKFSQDLITAQEEERTRISKDLHDSVGQQLTLIKKKAQTLNQEELSKMSNDALEEVRSISRDLYPATLKQLGFTQSVEQLVNNLDEGVDMFFTFEVDEIDNDLDEEKSLNLYRFIQESLSNVIKHSNAKAVSVTITKNLNQIEAIISDNGKGFNSAVVKNSLGLKTMAERIKMLKGTLSIKSRVDQGTTLIAQIPV